MYKISILELGETDEIKNKNYLYHFKKYEYIKKDGKGEIRGILERAIGEYYYKILTGLRDNKNLLPYGPLLKDGLRACAEHLISYFEAQDMLLSLFKSKRISNTDARRGILKLFACWILQN
jgi:hypothetical protein